MLAIGLVALMFTGNLGQSFFIGTVSQSDIANSLNLSTGEFGCVLCPLHHDSRGISWCCIYLKKIKGQETGLDCSSALLPCLVLTQLLPGWFLLTTSPWLNPRCHWLGLVRLVGGQGLMTLLGSTFGWRREFTLNRGRCSWACVSLGMPLGLKLFIAPVYRLINGCWVGSRISGGSSRLLSLLAVVVIMFIAPWPDCNTGNANVVGSVQNQRPQPDLLEKNVSGWLFSHFDHGFAGHNWQVFLFFQGTKWQRDFKCLPPRPMLWLNGDGHAPVFPEALLGGRWIDEFRSVRAARTLKSDCHLLLANFISWRLIRLGGNAGVFDI